MEQPPETRNSEPICRLSDGIARYSDIKSTARHASNKNVTKYLRDRFPSPYSEADAKAWFDICYDPENLVCCGPWALETGSQGTAAIPTNYAITVNDEAVGSIGLDFGKDIYYRTAELGYWLGEDHWDKGVMSRVVPAFVEWTWSTFGILVRLNAATYERNVGSQNVLKKAGFVFEGRRENSAFKNGELVTELMWGALRPT